MGSAPVTQPVPNRGNEVIAAQRIGLLTQLMGETIGIAGGASDMGLALAECIKKLAKFSNQSSGNPAASQEALKGLMAKQAQMQNMPQKPPAAA